MSEERVFPGSTSCKIVERRVYEWRDSIGHIETYVFEKDGKYFRVSFNDVIHPPGSSNSLEPGWQTPREIDGYRYAMAFNGQTLGPSIIELQPSAEEKDVQRPA